MVLTADGDPQRSVCPFLSAQIRSKFSAPTGANQQQDFLSFCDLRWQTYGGCAKIACSVAHFPSYTFYYFPARSLFTIFCWKPFTPAFSRRQTRPGRSSDPKFPVKFPCSREFVPRDGFAGDCVLRQTVCRSENGSLISYQNPDSRFSSARNGGWYEGRWHKY